MKLEGYSNYEIYPNEGKVWSYKTKRFIEYKEKTNQYWYVRLSDDNGNKKKWRLHRLIWTIVNGEIPKGLEVNHLDEDKDNNSNSNLNLMTHQQNNNWGTINKRRAKKLNNPVVLFYGANNITVYPSTMEVERKLGIKHQTISNRCYNGKEYNGMYFQYMDDYLADWFNKEYLT